jgi:hypothetical protein
MRLIRHAFAAAVLPLVGVVAIAATPSAAASGDLLSGHGNFERPVVSGGLGKVFASGAIFDGWKVHVGKVTLSRKASGIIVPPQGRQALVLADAFANAPATAGEVCRPIATIAGHKYTFTFLAAVVTLGPSQIVMKIGSSSSHTVSIAPTLPAKFGFHSLTLKATKTNAQLCITASNAPSGAFPAVDRVAVHDRGCEASTAIKPRAGIDLRWH